METHEQITIAEYQTIADSFRSAMVHWYSNSKFNNPPTENLSLCSYPTREWNCGLIPRSPFRTEFEGYLV